MKKRIALLLVLCMLISLITACGSTGNTTTESASPAESDSVDSVESVVEDDASEAESVTEEPAEEEEFVEETISIFPLDDTITLTAWAMWIPGIEQYVDSPADTLVMQEMAEQTNVKIDMTLASSPDTAMTEINLLIASGSYPDLINNFSGYYSAGIDSAINEEIIINIDDYADLMPNYYAKLAERNALDEATTDAGNIGAVYQINSSYDLDGESGLVLRQDWMEELGLEAPTTYDELYEILVAFKNTYGVTSALFVPKTGIPDGLFDGFGSGLDFVLNTEMGSAPWNYIETETGLEVVFGYMDDSFYDALVMLNSWYDAGLFNSDYINNNYNIDASDLVSGESACFYATQSLINSANLYQEHMYAAYANVSEDGSAIVAAADQYSALSAQGYSITTTCENIEIALQYLDYQYSDEAYILNNYGVEGYTFEYNEDGDPVLTDLIMNNADGIAQSYTQFIYLSVTGSFYCDSDRFKGNYCTEAKECFDIWNSGYDYYESPYNTNNITLTAEESEEYSQIFADISTYCVEMVTSFIVGQTELTEANFAEFQANLVAMGIEDCQAIYQAAADRYVASLDE